MSLQEIVQSADWKMEKHVPVIDAPTAVSAGEKFEISVTVGKEIPHPNTTEHHIRWIKVFFKPNESKFAYDVTAFEFNAHGESTDGPNKGPVYTEPLAKTYMKLSASGTLVATAYCNIHGLWESSQQITVK